MATISVTSLIKQLTAAVLVAITLHASLSVDCRRHRRHRSSRHHKSLSPSHSTSHSSSSHGKPSSPPIPRTNRREVLGNKGGYDPFDHEGVEGVSRVYSRSPGSDGSDRKDHRHLAKSGRGGTRLATRNNNRLRSRRDKDEYSSDDRSEESDSSSRSSSDSPSSSSGSDAESTDQDSASHSEHKLLERRRARSFLNTNPRILTREHTAVTPQRGRGQTGNLAMAPLMNRTPGVGRSTPLGANRSNNGLLQVNSNRTAIQRGKRHSFLARLGSLPPPLHQW